MSYDVPPALEWVSRSLFPSSCDAEGLCSRASGLRVLMGATKATYLAFSPSARAGRTSEIMLTFRFLISESSYQTWIFPLYHGRAERPGEKGDQNVARERAFPGMRFSCPNQETGRAQDLGSRDSLSDAFSEGRMSVCTGPRAVSTFCNGREKHGLVFCPSFHISDLFRLV